MRIVTLLAITFCLSALAGAIDAGPTLLPPLEALQRDVASEYAPRPYPPAEEVLSGELDKKLPPGPLYPEPVEPVAQGFQADRLSKIRAPGLHPRIIMSPEDIEQIRRYAFLRDSAPPAFQVAYAALKKSAEQGGDTIREYPPWIGPCTPIACKALLALILEDRTMGCEVVPRILEHARQMAEKLVVWKETEFGEPLPGMQGAKSFGCMYAAPYGHSMSLCMEYDYAHQFMTDEERATVRAVIADYTAGRYTSFMEMPDHFLINNHWGFAMNWWVGALAIEGEDGWDPRVGELGRRKVTAYVTSALSPSGMMFEGQKPNLPPYAILAAARRGPRSLAMHPHLHAYALAAANSFWWKGAKKDAKGNETPGRWMTGRIGYRGLGDEIRVLPDTMMKYFYPDDPLINLVWRIKSPAAAYGARNPNSHAGSGHGGLDIGLLYAMGAINEDERARDPDSDGLPPEIISKVPLTWHDPLRGAVRTRSGWGKDDLVLWFESKSDYFSAGHEVSEHNNFLFASHGVAWTPYAGRYQPPKNQNMILIDGLAAPRWQPVPGRILGVYDSAAGTAAAGDATDGYNWDKQEKMQEAWHPALAVKGWSWMKGAGKGCGRDWELPFHPIIRRFNEGFAHLEWGNWHGETRGPERYRQWNQVERVLRTVQLARGRYPYLLVIDDVRKDERMHLFDWVLNMNRSIKLLKSDKDDLILGEEGTDAQLLVRVLFRKVHEQSLPPAFADHRVVISAAAVEPEFRVLLYPHRKGEKLPQTDWSPDRRRLYIRFGNDTDVYHFGRGEHGRTLFALERNGKLVQTTAARPPRPELANIEKWYGSDCAGLGGHHSSTPAEQRDYVFPFVGQTEVRFRQPTPGVIIRYTLDGAEPTAKSPIYAGAVPLSKTTTLRAKTFARGWRFGEEASSPMLTARFVAASPAAATTPKAPVQPGLLCEVFEVVRTIYEKDGFFSGRKNMMPEFLRQAGSTPDREPRLCTVSRGLAVPQVQPLAHPRRMSKAFYRYTGFLRVGQTGLHRFRLHCSGPVRLTIGGRNVIGVTGQYYLSQRDRYGAAALARGLHQFELVFCDPAFYRGRHRNVFKDYGHHGRVPISITYEPPLRLALDILVPDAKAYRAIKPAELLCKPGPSLAAEPIKLAPVEAEPQAGVRLYKYDRSEAAASTSDGFLKYAPELLATEALEPFSDDTAPALADNNVRKGNELHEYRGLFLAPAPGLYFFRTDRAGVNELRLHNRVVQNSRITGEWPAGCAWLEAGWHPFSLRLFRSDAVFEVKGPGLEAYQQVSMASLGH